jgi:hypothetical protein
MSSFCSLDRRWAKKDHSYIDYMCDDEHKDDIQKRYSYKFTPQNIFRSSSHFQPESGVRLKMERLSILPNFLFGTSGDQGWWCLRSTVREESSEIP